MKKKKSDTIYLRAQKNQNFIKQNVNDSSKSIYETEKVVR